MILVFMPAAAIAANIILVSCCIAISCTSFSKLRPIPEVLSLTYFLFLGFVLPSVGGDKIYLFGSFFLALSGFAGISTTLSSYIFGGISVPLYPGICALALVYQDRRQMGVAR
jgi:hypothetical protein